MIMSLRSLPTAALSTAALALALMLAGGGYIAAQERDRSALHISQYPIVGDDDQRVANHAVKLPGPIERLPGVVIAANPKGNTTLVEFYDMNCPFCRIASVDIGDMVATDSGLKLVLVPYPVLGIASYQASLVELAVEKLGTPQQFYTFHQRVYAARGTTDGFRALAIAHSLGFDEGALTKIADSDRTAASIKNLIALGGTLGLQATPSFIAGGVAILGYPGRNALQAVVDAVGNCGKVVC
jgi:protein-disulfide isomerase